MAVLTITPENVKFIDKNFAMHQLVEAGETVTQGQPLYLAADGLYYKAANAVDEITARATLISLGTALVNEPVLCAKTGSKVGIGATVAKGTVYVVGTTAGSIETQGDLVGGEYLTVIGYANTTTSLLLNINATGITL